MIVFLKAPFRPKKGPSKPLKQPFFELFYNHFS